MLPECKQSTSSCEIKLRELEIDSYSRILSVFRARGNLTNERRKLLKQISSFLNISQERHRAEVRRVTNDDLLSSIASRLTGHDWTIDWREEGKRLVPTPTPFSHFTVNTPFADYVASVASLGKKYVDLYNRKICDPVPNAEKISETLEATSENSSENWLNNVNKVFTSVQKEKTKDASIQTKKKVMQKSCSYCQRRKEMRKKRLEAKERASPDVKDGSTDEKLEPCDSSIILPSGKQIVIENAFSDHTDDFSVSIIAQEVVVETEPIAGPSGRSVDLEERLQPPIVNLTTPDFTGLILDNNELESQGILDSSSLQQTLMTLLEDSEKPIPPRIPRILNSGPRKKPKKSPPSHSSKHYSQGERGVRKKVLDPVKESVSCDLPVGPSQTLTSVVRVSKSSQPSSSRQGLSKYHTASVPKYGEGITKYQECQPHVRPSDAPSKQHHVGAIKHRDTASRRHDAVSVTNETTYKRNEGTSKSYETVYKNYESNFRHCDDLLKHHDLPSKQPETSSKHHETNTRLYHPGVSKQKVITKYNRVTPRSFNEPNLPLYENSLPKPSTGIYKHYVRVRHTPKAAKPYLDPSKLLIDNQSSSSSSIQFNETVEIPIEYLQTQHPDIFETSMEVVEINDYKIDSHNTSDGDQSSREDITIVDDMIPGHPSVDQLTNLISSDCRDTVVEGILIPSSQDSSENISEESGAERREDHPSRKVIKIYNGEKKIQRTIHFRSERMKDMINKLSNAQVSQGDVNNGCQLEENTNIVWDGANFSGDEFIMEDVSIVDESSYPIINGHEEIILEEEVLSDGQLIETLVEKSDVCVLPQTDMKFSVVDISDYTGPIENIHSVSSQSKDDSRDSDILMNRP